MSFVTLFEKIEARVRPPALVVMGSPRTAAELAARLPADGAANYQMDLYQAGRAREQFAEAGVAAAVEVAPDLWDLPPRFVSVVYPVPARGERELKLDVVEQAWHVLADGGYLYVLSEVPGDTLFPDVLKKVFGKVSSVYGDDGSVFWCQRAGERKRRRHEVTVQANVGLPASVRFVTRPGVFTHGKLDDGSRALLAESEIHPGERVLDMGCGTGVTGVVAGLKGGRVTFIDSNVRATELARQNAAAAGLTDFDVVASPDLSGVADGTFDVVLANPPYYAQGSIAGVFIERSRELLKPDGRLYLVTKQPAQVEEVIVGGFADAEVRLRGGYHVYHARNPH